MDRYIPSYVIYSKAQNLPTKDVHNFIIPTMSFYLKSDNIDSQQSLIASRISNKGRSEILNTERVEI